MICIWLAIQNVHYKLELLLLLLVSSVNKHQVLDV